MKLYPQEQKSILGAFTLEFGTCSVFEENPTASFCLDFI